MKLHLPHTLFRALMACFAPIACLTMTSVASAAYMHSSPSIQVYTDLAENRGVYRFDSNPSVITYRNGEADYTLSVTPDYTSAADNGAFTLTHNNGYVLSVQHNGIFDNSFSSRFVGDNAQQYTGVGIRYNKTFVFGCGEYGNNDNPYVSFHEDYKVERLSRLVTDADSVHYNTDPSVLANLKGTTIYRVGAGNSGWYDTQGNINWNVGAWGSGLTAGITQMAGSYNAGNGLFNIEYSPQNYEICTPDNALPSTGQPGDSGSPVYIYNEAESRFEFVGSLQGASDTFWIARYNPSATTEAIDYCTRNIVTTVDSDGTDATTYFISGAHMRDGDELIQDGSAATYLREGTISLNGQELARFNGVALDEFSQGTWKKLDADALDWYTYSDSDFINATPNTAQGADGFGAEDLFYTSNLHFKADADGSSTTAHRRIELTEDVDLGVGHVQFSLGEGTTAATYDIGQSSSDKFLSSAGFVVDKGVTVNNYFTYEKGRELRRVGEGVMNMVGTGNNDVLLNIGGNGLTYLNRTDGYAAYSALVNTEAVLSLADAGQVYNNVTLGAGGGVLDFNGNDYRWTSGGARAEGSDGKMYFGLTVYEGLNRVETSAIANYKAGSTATITIERSDDFEFAGAFRDGSTYTDKGSVEMDSRYTMMPSQLMGLYQQFAASDRKDSDSTLKVIYNGGGTMAMTGVYTILTGDSGFEVASGKVSLHGTNTIHAIGSETGKDFNRLQNANDWHYAMAEMDVKVGADGTFELGDHALLIGNVQVSEGGNFVMKQAVHSRYEYVEGWYKAEDTYAFADYYGLKGDVSLAAGANMTVRFDEGVATKLSYGGNISGEGSVTVEAGAGSVQLSGQNSFSGTKTVASGHLRVAEGAEGNTSSNKWLVQEQGSLALDAVSSNADVERLVDGASTGVLALTKDFAEQLAHGGLIAGAAEGESVHYGTSSQSLLATAGQWTLGGGGGTLLVDFKLEGANKLVLGNEYGTGTVVLTNAANSFSGGIETAGKVTLGYTDAAALGNNVLSIGYGKALAAVNGAAFAGSRIDAVSTGVFALSGGSQHYDLSGHGSLSLGAHGEATLTGALTVAEGASYRLGGAGSLTIASALSGNHGILVDGQGTTGSSVTFATASADTGAVVVQGYDAAKASSGDVTLSFTTDNALVNASSITLQNNAGIDLNGTNQSFNKLTGDAGSLIFDDKGGNTLTLNNAEKQTLNVRVQAAGTDVVKTGSGTLVLTGEKLWKSFSINEGTVQVADGKALGYLASGSQGIDVNVNNGGMLHLTTGMSFDNTLNIAGYGADGASVALKADGHLNNTLGVLNVVGDAAISGQFSFKQVNLQGNDLSLQGSGSGLTTSAISAGSLKLSEGAALNWNSNKGGAGVALELNNATVNVAGGSFAGTLTIGEKGGTIYYPWNNTSTDAFNLTGYVSGTSAESTLKLVGYKHTFNLAGGADIAGAVEVGNGLTLNVTKDASVGALVNESGVGDLSTVKVDAARLTLTGTGNNFGSNGNPGNLELTNGGQLQLVGFADGASMGSLGSLNMGENGYLALTSLAGYGSNAMMHIGELSGTGKLLFDAAELNVLGAGTYHLLTSGSKLTDALSLMDGLDAGRREFSLTSTELADGSWGLDLTVGAGVAANATWKGTGTLVTGTANAANITTDLTADDHTFRTLDSLTITSDAGANDTLTLSGDINATSVTYTGAGTVTLAQQDGGKFAKGQDVVVDGTGTLALGDTQAISGEIELKQGTLSASSTSLNGTEGVHVTGDAGFELTSATHVTAGIQIEKGKTLALSFKDNSMASQWGGNFDNNLSGEGKLAVNIGSGRELHLNGDHSAFTGSIDVQTGTLQLGLWDNGTLFGSTLGAQNISVANGATLSLCSTGTTLAADIAWAGGATLQVKDGVDNAVAYKLSGTQTLGGALTISNTAGKAVHISGDVVGTGSLNFTSGGDGEAAFLLSGNNTYSGGTTINRSNLTVYAGSEGAFGTGAIKLRKGTLSWQGVGGDWNGELTASSIEASAGTTLNTNGYDVTYGGSVSGTITKSGAGTLMLTQNYTNTGATHVQEGTLALNIGKSSWYTGFSGDEGATLRLSSTSPYGTYLMGVLSGGMTVELAGDFGYVAANTHTGGTKLLSGSLEIGNVAALQSGSLQAAAGTEVSIVMANTYMAGDSSVDKLSFGSGASVLVGTDAAAGHLSFNSLEGSGSFLLDVFSAESYDRLSGTLTPGSLLSVNLKTSELGSYLLVEGDNSGFDTSAFTYSGSTNSEHIYLWSSSERGITLSIESASLADDANVWTGGNNGTWDASGQGWYGNSFDSEKKALVIANGNTAISVAGVVVTSTLEADVAEGATLSFSPKDGGSISATTLQKDGAGTLNVESDMGNSFGSVVVNEGTLSISAADGNPLGTAMISGNGTFELTGGSLRADLNAGAMSVKNIRLDGGSLVLHSTAYWGTGITGRSIEILGEGSSLTLEKWANLNDSSVLLRDGGTLYTGNNGLGNDGGTINVDGRGTIKGGNAGAGNIVASISGKGSLTIADWNSDQINLRGSLSDAEEGVLSLVLNKQNLHISNPENGAATINTYSGGTTIIGGSVITEKESALGTGTVTINGGSLTQKANLSIGSLSGTGGEIQMGTHNLTINQNGTGSYEGNISGSGTITKNGVGTLTLSGNNAVTGDMVVNSGKLAYNAGSSSLLGAVSGNGTFALVGGAVNASSINVGKLEVADAILAYSSTFDGKQLEVSGLGAELRMGHWASVNNSSLLLKDGGRLSMSSSGFSGSTVTVEGEGTLAIGETASRDDKPLLNINSTISGSGTLHVIDYGSRAYTTNINKAIADGSEGALAVTTDQSNLHFTVVNTYSGGTTVNGGKLTAEVVGALGSGAVTVNGGELTLALGNTAEIFHIGSLSGMGGAVNIAGNTFIINQKENGRFDGSFSGSGDIIKRGDATLELGGSVASIGLQLDSGTVRVVDSDVFDSTSVVTMNGGVFDINGQTSGSGADSFMFDVNSGYLAFRGSDDMLVTDSSGRADSGLGFNTAYSYTAVSKRGSGRAEIAANIISGGEGAAGAKIGFGIQEGELEVSGDIGADRSVAEHHHFGISKTGEGTMILSGNNGYSGGTEVKAGTLIAASDTALGTGSVSVASGASLEIAAGKQISLEGASSVDVAESYTVSRNEASGESAVIGSVKMGAGYIHGQVEGGLATIDHAVIDIAKGVTLEMKDVLLTENSRITDDPATVSMENVTIAVGEANAIIEGSSTLSIGTELVQAGGSTSISLTEAAPIVSIFSSALDTVNVTGSSLTIDLTGFASSLGESWQANQYVAISFGQTKDSLAHFDATGLSISATYNGATYEAFVNKAEQASASMLYVSTGSDAVPEPTTATLSLLALSMLAARRRRK